MKKALVARFGFLSACTAAILACLGGVPVRAEGDVLQRGSYSIRHVRILSIESDATVRLSQDTTLAADKIILGGTIVTNGYLLRIDARDIIWQTGASIVAFDSVPGTPSKPPKQARGPSGVAFPKELGSPHSIRHGKQGSPGSEGSPGIPGEQDPAAIFLVAMDLDGAISVDATGQKGGKGGPGGDGGDGGDGARGRDARCGCGTVSAGCVSYKGEGYRGGTSGNGGPGGKGGKAGRGGTAVPVVLAVSGLDGVLAESTVNLGPGTAGARGDPGRPGSPGQVGAAGRRDGCCADVKLFGLFCQDGTGAAGGVTTTHPNPGHLGLGDENIDGENVDIAAGMLSAFAGHVPLKSESGAINGYARNLDDVRESHERVLDDLIDFNISRTFGYLLHRSFAIAGVKPNDSETNPSETQELVAEIVSDIWDAQFVNPLLRDIRAGNVSNVASAKAWVRQGEKVVRLFGSIATPGALKALNETLQDAGRDVEEVAARLAEDCVDYSNILAGSSELLVISHQFAAPTCRRLSQLSGIQLILEPLAIREPLVPVPPDFEKFVVDDPLELAARALEGPRYSFIELLLGLLGSRANAQSIKVEVVPLLKGATIVNSREVGLDPRDLADKRFVVQSFGVQEGVSYSATDLSTDLRLFGGVVR